MPALEIYAICFGIMLALSIGVYINRYYATLMPAGRDLLDEMRPVVVAELKVAFAAKLSAAEADALRETLERVRVSACGAE